MLGMDQGQRSNAVGFNTAYLPDGEGARHGGGTYTGQATEPTIQDYENFFGPSARDIKTDLQRFKRHGRWHLPDILQGPNPWLTDRIDGLITDATNSPFTTKILPYRYKEEVDGKIKWNVWSFDEGMASRVPYESAARTLTQSKRSFAGYMVRQGMAIVLEHNFMMTPKGRENFKNQLNQLIGSIQYTNDLDVHMALILAPSYQKTMRERYYTTDKSPAQICREFADLFGMMQKNVNALDILIEEGKAILRTWGGPMPDFLLCNSKLTFQMTMTPEKTNYITQGIDGVKRLRQGPDLGSYRGLSVIHSRSFAMETGQHPRDVLRRRVRTAEYYRIPPSKRNAVREFEFYNEERDTWFTLTFHDLLRYARYHGGDDISDNSSQIDSVLHRLSLNPAGKKADGAVMLGAPAGGLGAPYQLNRNQEGDLRDVLQYLPTILDQALAPKLFDTSFEIDATSSTHWYVRGLSRNLGLMFTPPRKNGVWEKVTEEVAKIRSDPYLNPFVKTLVFLSPFTPKMTRHLYAALKNRAMYNPFKVGSIAAPKTPQWFAAFSFYMEILKRGGLEIQAVNYNPPADNWDSTELAQLGTRDQGPSGLDYTGQFLGMRGLIGSVNHPWVMSPSEYRYGAGNALDRLVTRRETTDGARFANNILLTVEVLETLLAEYSHEGVTMIGIDLLIEDGKRNAVRRDFAYGVMETLNRLFLAGTSPYLTTQYDVNAYLRRVLPFMIREMNAVRTNQSHGGILLAENGISTIPMFWTSVSHLFHNILDHAPAAYARFAAIQDRSYGHLSCEMLKCFADDADVRVLLSAAGNGNDHDWFQAKPNWTLVGLPPPPPPPAGGAAGGAPVDPSPVYVTILETEFYNFMREIRRRMFDEPEDALDVMGTVVQTTNRIPYMGCSAFEEGAVTNFLGQNAGSRPSYYKNFLVDEKGGTVIDLDEFFDPPPETPPQAPPSVETTMQHVENTEIVIVRPNIEHNMLGVIMGLGGESLGNTLWGQTELSVYDDSMHGIWGMSYKYHERAIVFNEKNLIRMWDIAYDGYNGGKDDTYVDWTGNGDQSARNGPDAFKNATLDVSKNYRGPSMMVMAFVHKPSQVDEEGRSLFERHFRRNWPSPVVFYDTYDRGARHEAREALPIDYDNVQTVDVEEFRVFNNDLYAAAYRDYRGMMPEFRTMHLTRKTAGQSSADSETATDCLAFQGSMRVKENGAIVQEIHGSGHHGPDYVGIASVRAGKGQKVAGQAPAPYRLV